MELLLCYNDEGVYVNTYSEVTKDVMMQWGELPASVAYIRSGQVRPIYYTMADLLKHGKTNRYMVYNLYPQLVYNTIVINSLGIC